MLDLMNYIAGRKLSGEEVVLIIALFGVGSALLIELFNHIKEKRTAK